MRSIDWINFGLLVLLFLSCLNGCSSRSGNSDSNDFRQALRKADDSLKSKDYQTAYDMLLVAFRVSPSDPRLIGTIEAFANSARSSNTDEALTLAEDLIERCDALIAFQSPDNVESTRKKLSSLQDQFLGTENEARPTSPLSNIEPLVRIASDGNAEIPFRTRAAQQARSMLEDMQFEALQSSQVDTTTNKKIQDMLMSLDQSEDDCIKLLYASTRAKASDWVASVSKLAENPILNEKMDQVPDDNLSAIDGNIDKSILDGTNLLQDLTPFAKSQTDDASTQVELVSGKIENLQRLKNWLYNKKILFLVRNLESKEWASKPAQEKLLLLAEVKEELLTAYVMQRHSKLWENLFEPIKDEQVKIDLVRRRLLKVKG
jgi:hypothetical protein